MVYQKKKNDNNKKAYIYTRPATVQARARAFCVSRDLLFLKFCMCILKKVEDVKYFFEFKIGRLFGEKILNFKNLKFCLNFLYLKCLVFF